MGWYLPPRHVCHCGDITFLQWMEERRGERLKMSDAWEMDSPVGPEVVWMTFSAAPPTWCWRKEQITLLLGTDAWLAACSSANSSDPQVEAVNRRLIKLPATTMQLSLTFLLRTLNKPHNILSRTRTNILIRSKRESVSEWRAVDASLPQVAEGARGAEMINVTLKSAGPTFSCHSRSSCCWALLGAPEPYKSRWGGTKPPHKQL